MTVDGPMTRSDRVATLEEAKAQFQKSCDAWKAWAKLLTLATDGVWPLPPRTDPGEQLYKTAAVTNAQAQRLGGVVMGGGSPVLFETGAVLTDDRIHASTDARPIARCLRYGRPAPKC